MQHGRVRYKYNLEIMVMFTLDIALLLQVTAAATAKSLQSSPTLCDPIDSSPAGSSVPGILQSRTLEWLPFPCPLHKSEK